MTKIAKQYFGYKNDPRINIVHSDGRIFLNKNRTVYDVIFIDAFKSFEPPYNLSTLEAIDLMNKHLSDNGLVIANYISAIDGPNGKFIQAEYQTFKQSFCQTYLFMPESLVPKPKQVQNIMLVASKSDQKYSFDSDDIEQRIFLKSRWDGGIPTRPILTDDLAPIEYYLKDLLSSV
jgi:spermidine synthase